jgi:hypothetical protein
MSVELVNEVGVNSQIPDKRMGLGEAEDLPFDLFADKTAKIFKPKFRSWYSGGPEKQ